MRRSILGFFLLALTGIASAQSPAMRERMSGTVRAINGTAEEFESYAKEGFAKSLLDKETAAQRRKWFETVRAEYGTLQPGRAAREDPMRVRLQFTGTKKNGALILDHEADPVALLAQADQAVEQLLPAPVAREIVVSAKERRSALGFADAAHPSEDLFRRARQ